MSIPSQTSQPVKTSREVLRILVTLVWVALFILSFIQYRQEHEAERIRIEHQLHPEAQNL